jgi:hypothetical protein
MLGEVDGDDYLEAGEYIGLELINERNINMDKNPSDAFDFIEQALENANSEGEPWWV